MDSKREGKKKSLNMEGRRIRVRQGTTISTPLFRDLVGNTRELGRGGIYSGLK